MCILHQLRPSFSRSYGRLLPSSLTRVFPRTLGSSPRLPVSVYGTGTYSLVRSFSRQWSPPEFGPSRGTSLSVSSRPFIRGICLPYSLPPSTHSSIRVLRLLPVSLHPQAAACSTGMFASCPSPMRLRLGLGPDLPRDDERCPGTLGLSVGRILTVRFATHTGILTSVTSSSPSGLPSSTTERSPTHGIASMPRLRFCASAPDIFGAGPLDQ